VLHNFCKAMRSIIIAVFAFSLFGVALGQNTVLDSYISEGVSQNHGLKQQHLDFSKNLSALKEARGMFFPNISVNARYTVAQGGRIIEFPVGDMLNPVYSTLNLLTASSMFPPIENQEFGFYRPKEHETKVSMVAPIFNSDLIYNYKVKEDFAEISKISISRYKRELIKDITKAYYNYQKAYYLAQLADTTIFLVNENVRVSRALFENDKVTIDAVYRSESELAKVEVKKAESKNLLEASKAYFNFLLNRPFEADIELVREEPAPVILALDDAQDKAIKRREELKHLQQYQHLNRNITKMHKGKNIPGLFGVVDYGFQGDDYSFTNEDDFVMASLVLKWDLFQGTANLQKTKQSRIEGEILLEAYAEAEQQIRLDVLNNYYAVLTAYESVLASKKQTLSASRAYTLIYRKYKEGQSSLLELIDARTSMTSASTNSIIAANEYFIRKADLEYATGAIDLSSY